MKQRAKSERAAREEREEQESRAAQGAKAGRRASEPSKAAGLSSKERRWRRAMAWGARLGCHQRPERSFFFHGRQCPVCARCMGVWIGYGVGLLVLLLWQPPFWLSCALAGVMLLDWTVQRVGWRESTNARRLATGILGGFGVLTGGLTAVFWLAQKIFLPMGL